MSFIENNMNENEALEKFEEFARDKFIIPSRSFEEYMTGYISKSRIMIISVMNFCTFLTVLRFGLSALINTESIRQLMCDFGYALNESRLISTAMSTLALAVLSSSLVVNYKVLTNDYYFINFLYEIKSKNISYPLSEQNMRKWSIKFSILTKYLLNPSFYSLYFIVFILQFYLIFESYFEYNSYESILKMIFWNIIYSLYLIHNCGLLWFGFIGIYQMALYLRYKFNEINHKISLSLKKSDLNLLLNAFKEHDFIEILNNNINHTFKHFIFILYYIATPGFEMVLFSVHDKRQTLFGKIFSAFVFFICFSAVFIMTFVCSEIPKSAHKSYPLLFSFIHRNRIPLKHKLKILSFIEKLSGPDIGFYCYNLFPMNSYEFYQFIYISAVNYILIMNFI